VRGAQVEHAAHVIDDVAQLAAQDAGGAVSGEHDPAAGLPARVSVDPGAERPTCGAGRRQPVGLDRAYRRHAAGRREVPIPPPAHDALTAWKAADPQPGGYVWRGDDGGPFAHASVVKRAKAAWKRAELDPVGLHEARHSAASMWIASGWSVKVVSELIGRASIAITLDRYGHLFPAALDDAAAAFAAYLERADSASRIDQLEGDE